MFIAVPLLLNTMSDVLIILILLVSLFFDTTIPLCSII